MYSKSLFLAHAGPPLLRAQGEGRAVAASKALMLGEPLPTLQLRLYDALGNQVPYVPPPPDQPSECRRWDVAGSGGLGSMTLRLT